MLLVGDVLQWLQGLAQDVGQAGLNRDEGLRWGEPELPVRAIQVCWMPTTAAIVAAGESGANLIVAHEDLFYPYDVLVNGGRADFLTWRTNQRRAQLLSRYGVACIRAHGTVDRSHIFDAFAELLALPGAGVRAPTVGEPPYQRIYEIVPQSVENLAQHVKACTGMPALRIAGDLHRIVQRVGLPWGGMGLFVNISYMQQLVALGADVFIAGESDNYAMRFAIEADVPLIETSHEVSENPGLRQFSAALGRRFPGVPVTYYENQVCWQVR